MKKRSPNARIRELAATNQNFGKPHIQHHSDEAAVRTPPSARGSVTELRRSQNIQRVLAAEKQVVERSTGGAIEIDVCGSGTLFPASSFPFRMADNALAELGILSGDIAIVEPTGRRLRVGDILLITLYGRETLRRVTKRKSILYLEEAGGETALLPLWQHPYQGIVIGTIRLFKRAPSSSRRQPVTYVVPTEIEPPRENHASQQRKGLRSLLRTSRKRK